MSKNRYVNTRFWNDGFISDLDPLSKLLFIYFITNEHTNICGIYELPLKIAAIETGIDATMFEKMLPDFVDKIVYIDGWVCIKNFPKHQFSDNYKIKIGIEKELGNIPTEILSKAIAYGYPMHNASHSNLNSNRDLNPNPNSNASNNAGEKPGNRINDLKKQAEMLASRKRMVA